MIAKLGGRKCFVAVLAIFCITILGFASHPEVAASIAAVAVAFQTAHAAADWKKVTP